MDRDRFDHLARSLATLLTRRRLAGVFGLGALALPGLIGAKKRHKQKRKKKIKRNDFGCVNVGKFCKRNGQCCSGICRGKKSKKKCKAHDTGGCQAALHEADCGGVDVPCVTSTGEEGVCDATTGKAPYCTRRGDCFACSKDADCAPFCGPQGACIICSGCGSTACVGPSEDSCTFPP